MFEFKNLQIPDIKLITPKINEDNRGSFLEIYNKDSFSKFTNQDFVLDCFSTSIKNVIRGLHYQLSPHQQAKFVTVIKGRIFDVVVDIRPESETFGKFLTTIIDDEKKQILFIPEGFAHGFCALGEENILLYKLSKTYSFENSFGIIWNDPKLNIPWPVDNPLLSNGDKSHKKFDDIIFSK